MSKKKKIKELESTIEQLDRQIATMQRDLDTLLKKNFNLEIANDSLRSSLAYERNRAERKDINSVSNSSLVWGRREAERKDHTFDILSQRDAQYEWFFTVCAILAILSGLAAFLSWCSGSDTPPALFVTVALTLLLVCVAGTIIRLFSNWTD